MSDTAATTLRRLFHLIPRLADDDEHVIEEIAREANTTAAQLMSDFVAISERFDVPGAFVEGVSILVDERTVTVHANHFHRPMRLTMPELCALELGLMVLRPTRTPAEQQPLDRALARLRDTVARLPTNDRHEGTRYAELADTGATSHLATLRSAVRDHRRVRLRYRAGAATASSVRDLSPHSLAFAEQLWYLVTTGDDGELRFFRLDRVEGVDLLDDVFEPNEGIAERARAAGRAFASDAVERMTVRYSPRIARWVAEREGKELDADGGLTLEHTVADEAWAIRHVLQYGADAEILAPQELRDAIVGKLASV
ncbi:MAG TPA: WYL domain-containing protein [Gemmatimonadaceae bacterium]|jgi:proteasome accessory factor C